MRTTDSAELQERILAIIARSLAAAGRPPTVREIGWQLGIASTGHVTYHLEQLIATGRLARTPHVSRGLTLLAAPPAPRGIPVLGDIAAGVPLAIADSGDSLDTINREQYPIDTFALRVRGDSMIEDHILDGDYVLIAPTTAPEHRAIIVATHLTDGERGAATLKRFLKHRTKVVLAPANATYAPLHIPAAVWDREWQVQGTVRAILRLR